MTPISEDRTQECFSFRSLNLKTPSTFQSPKSSHAVETYVSLVSNSVDRCIQGIEKGEYHLKHNRSREETIAINNLKKNNKIIIKPADKGGSIVVLDKSYYLSEIYQQLSYTDTYTPVQTDPISQIKKKIDNLIRVYLANGTIERGSSVIGMGIQ
ncbi:unnamed protein product [Ranitomeya imitator]|uniref:Uncharacterized protein n=1 Tax=Ranitomeya imitator TaxID=111125 RepID=A0ABN9MMU2_9NEOB|nr:unnamed protein product [Ranitomeya imitator]